SHPESRQIEPERRSRAARLDRATAVVSLRDRVHDRESQANPALRARPRRVGAGEALEDVLERLRWDAAALVEDLDHDTAPVATRAELDRVTVLGVLDGILQQGVERDAQALRVGEQHARCEIAEPP